jgi:LPS sulfotransferase NodH
MEDPRDEAAVRTALMLGAEFVQRDNNRLYSLWTIKGIEHTCMTKAGIARLYLATHGITIDKHGTPRLFKDIQNDVAQLLKDIQNDVAQERAPQNVSSSPVENEIK